MKKNILFLPGMLCDARVFEPQIKFLNDYGHNTEVADLSKFDSMEGLAKNALELTSFSEFVLCGLSLGGILAMEMMVQNPEAIEGVILMDTNYHPDKAERKENRLRQLKKVEQDEFESVIIDELKPFYFKNNTGPRAEKMRDTLYQMAMDLGEATFINQTLALKNRSGYEMVLKGWNKPALIICGEADPLCPPEYHLAMQELMPQSELRIIKETGHVSSLEAAAEVNQTIKKWLEKISLN